MPLSPGWKSVNFSDIVKFTKKPRGFTYCDYDQVPFVPMEFLPTNGLFFEQFIFRKPDEMTSGTYFEEGDILVAKIIVFNITDLIYHAGIEGSTFGHKRDLRPSQ